MSLRERGKRNMEFPNAMPFFSTDTKEEAESMVVLFGSLSYDGEGYRYMPMAKAAILEGDSMKSMDLGFELTEKMAEAYKKS